MASAPAAAEPEETAPVASAPAAAEPEETAPVASAPAAAEPEEAVPVSSTLQLLNRNTPHQQIETAMMKRVIAPVILRRMPL